MLNLKIHVEKYKSFIIYTFFFFIVAVFIWNTFRFNEKLLIWLPDAAYQHYNAFRYISEYASSIGKALFMGEPLSVPLMNYTLGQGSDIITTLSSYDFLDPLCWFLAILFHKNTVLGYELMTLAKLYLTGFSFVCFCKSVRKSDAVYVPCGALIYSFCGFAIFTFVRHPNFMSGFYYFPFTLTAMEIYLIKKKTIPLIVTTFFAFITSFYCFFMSSICCIVYLLVRIWPSNKYSIKTSIIKFIKVGITMGIGLLLAAFIVLPTVYAFLNCSRMGIRSGYQGSLLIYPLNYYHQLIEYFFNPASVDFWSLLGFIPIALFTFWLLFLDKSIKWNRLRILNIIYIIFLLIPALGFMMMAFGYVSNKWVYVFSFIVSFTFTCFAYRLRQLSEKTLIILFSGSILISIICLNDPDYKTLEYMPILFLFISLAIVLIMNRPYITRKVADSILIVLVVISIIFNFSMRYDPDGLNYISEMADKNGIEQMFENFSIHDVTGAADSDSFYRVESMERRSNLEQYSKVNGTSYFWSILMKEYDDYYRTLQLNTHYQNCNLQGIDGRNALMALSAVKYYTCPADQEGAVPYGYEKISDQVYENRHYLSPAFLYDSFIYEEDFRKLNPLDRQQAMLQGAVLKKKPQEVNSIIPEKRMVDVPYTIKTKDIKLSSDTIDIKEKNGTITLFFDIPDATELYLWFDGIKLTGDKSNSTIDVESGLILGDTKEKKTEKESTIDTEYYNWPTFKDGTTFFLGAFNEGGSGYITIKFNNAYSFTYDNIKVFTNSIDTYKEDIEKLRASSCDDIKIDDDYIYGNVSCNDNSLLEISVPYSKGWTAYIDGEKADVLKSNLLYCALELSPGTHYIEMRYCTPLLKIGALISLITFIGLVAYSFKARKN